MKFLALTLLLLCALAATAQNYAVRFLSMDPAHEFNAVPGCPTNWPVARDHIGPAQSTTIPNRAILSQAQLDAVYANAGPAFTNWHTSTWKNFVATRDNSDLLARSNNIVRLKSLYADITQYETRWQAGEQATNAAQINAILRTHNDALLRLRPLLIELYRGD